MRDTAKRPRFLLLTCFGLGRLRPAPGTWGSMPPVVLALVLIALGLAPIEHPLVFNGVMLAIALLFSHVCVHQGDRAEAWFGRKDASEIVADETAAQALVLMFIPIHVPHDAGTWLRALALLAIAFLAFRAFDILKLPPARGLQRVPGGWGVLIDDLIMAIPAWLVVQGAGMMM